MKYKILAKISGPKNPLIATTTKILCSPKSLYNKNNKKFELTQEK